MAGAMHHDDRRPADGFRNAVLHVHLVDGDLARRRRAGCRRIGKIRGDDLAADEEAALVLQFERPAERPRQCGRHQHQRRTTMARPFADAFMIALPYVYALMQA